MTTRNHGSPRRHKIRNSTMAGSKAVVTAWSVCNIIRGQQKSNRMAAMGKMGLLRTNNNIDANVHSNHDSSTKSIVGRNKPILLLAAHLSPWYHTFAITQEGSMEAVEWLQWP